jgi:putative transposase
VGPDLWGYMPRPRRVDQDGTINHVIIKGCHGAVIVRDDDDRTVLMSLVMDGFEVCGWRVLTYCLMTNHMHLLIRTPDGGLSDGMHHVCSTYARYFRPRQRHVGSTFDGPFKSYPVLDDAYFATVTRYIAFNPVRAFLCERPEDWVDSAHAELLGLRGRRLIDVTGMFEILDPAEYVSLFRTPDVGAASERDRGVLIDALRGYTVREIAERRGVPARTVRRVLTAAGVKPMALRGQAP